MYQMLLKWSDITSPMKGDEGGFIKTDPTARSQNLGRTDPRDSLNLVLTSLFYPFEKLKTGEMRVPHENDNATRPGAMQVGNFP
jgi:hypothetical protein